MMSDPRNGGSDPSMDDILASIRKIISDDEARAQMTNQRTSGPLAPGQTARLSVVPPSEPPRPEPRSRSAGHDDVLLLTEDLMEDPTLPPRTADIVAPPNLQPRSEPPRPVEALRPAEAPRVAEAIVRTPDPVARAPEPPRSPSGALGPEAPLIDGSAAGAAADAFSRLSLAVQESVPTPAAGDPGLLVGGKPQTIEDLVKDMLRPMLKDWLDRNLPGIVERYVEREIVRLTRR
jgi:cell pole-organizing protein PopZ